MTEPFFYLAVFVTGLILGRISMAAQYSMMKKHAEKKRP